MKNFFFLAFMLVGVGVFCLGIRAYNQTMASKQWPTVPGRVLSSQVESKWDNSGERSHLMYSGRVKYRYAVGDQILSGGRVSFGASSSSASEDARAVVARYPIDKEVTVYYDPQKPEMAVLEPGRIDGIYIPLVVGVLFFVAGIFGLLWKQPQATTVSTG